MDRREALKVMAGLFAGTIYGAKAFAEAAQRSGETVLSPEDVSLLDEIGETILPATADSPGAKAAGIGSFMKEMVGSFYAPEERAVFVEGLAVFEKSCRLETGRSFLELSDEERQARLLALQRSKDKRFFRMLSQLTVWGYFSSEIGSTQARRHIPIPGRWEGCADLKPGQKSWA